MRFWSPKDAYRMLSRAFSNSVSSFEMMGSGGGTIHQRQKMASGTLGRALCGSRDYRVHLNVHSVEPSIVQSLD